MKRREFIQFAGSFGATPWFAPTSTGATLLNDERDPEVGPQPNAAQISNPISIHPVNPKYFLFRGKPLVVIAASEHYGSVVNRRFDFARYLAHAAESKQTMTRLFLLYRELQTSRNPCSPVKPESPDFIAPYPRTGPGKAMNPNAVIVTGPAAPGTGWKWRVAVVAVPS